MDALRQVAFEKNMVSKERLRTILFQKAFLDNIRRNGRLCELELIGEFKTRAFFKDWSIPMLLKDSLLAPKMMQLGKFHPFGQHAKDRGVVRRIFEKCQE
jgi:hypothetical protein